MSRTAVTPFVLAAGLIAAPAFAADATAPGDAGTAPDAARAEGQAAPIAPNSQPSPDSPSAPQDQPAGPPRFALAKPVFDETWATIGLGAGLVPSYAGSNNYIVFPLPLIVGRIGGIGVRPNGPGLTLDLLSPAPSFGKRKVRAALGPAFRIRNDRDAQIKDEVVARAGPLDLALEVGLNGAVAFPGVFKPFDTLTVGAQVRRDVLGAHGGTVIEPQVNYSSPIGRAALLQVQVGVEFVDDSFADYYFSVNPAQSAASGLPGFAAQGGLNRVGTLAIMSYDLDGNALNGGWSIYGVGGVSRLLGDAADSPFTALRGSPNQFITGLGVGYTF